MQRDPPTKLLLDLYEVRRELRLSRDELERLVEIGIITPVSRTHDEHPLFDAAAIDRLTSREQRARLRDAFWWDFEPHPDRKGRGGHPWAPPVDLPFYPFDDEEQHQWARKFHQWRKRYAPFPHPKRSPLTTRMRRAEEKATRAFEKAHGIVRPRPRNPRPTDIYIRRRLVRMTRAQIFKLVWSKTMIRAAADLDTSEFTLRSICKRLQIPTPPRGHFNHKSPAARTPRPTLPPFRANAPES